jgi:hypothetical protein
MVTPSRTAVILEACQREYRACDEAGRNAHLNGKVAAALMEKAKSGDLFAKKPEIHKLDILAYKLPK